MILQDVAWAYPDKAVSAPAALAGPAASIAIPGAMGRVEQSFDAASGRATVINVRDAHRKLNSQYSISRLLAHLADEYQMDFVAMEGSSGPVHTGLLAALPDHAARDKMADSLLRKGRLSAAEYFTITNGRSVKLYGAESPSLYARNKDLFEKVLTLYPKAQEMIGRLERRLDLEAQKILSPQALEFRAARSDFRRRKMPLDVYVKRLEAAGGIPADRFVHLSRYRRLLETESRLDLERIDAERRNLIRGMRLEDSALTPALARLTSDYASNKIGHAEFFRSLCALAWQLSIAIDEYASIRLYLRYWAEFGRLDLYGVWADVEAAERGLETALAGTADARDFFKRDDARILHSKLVTLGLTGEEYRRLRRDAGLRSSEEAATPDEKRLMAAALAFYAVAERRNHYLLKNTLAAMKRDGSKTAALVTGGFHSEGLSELMRRGQVSHLVVMPSFDPEGGDRPYVTVLTRRPVEWESRLSGGDLFLAAPAWIGRAPTNAREAEPLLAEFIAGRRAQGLPDFTASEMARYVSAYENLRRTDPAANPLLSEVLKEILDSVGSIRKVTPSTVEVAIGKNIWTVVVDEAGQPVGSSLAVPRAIVEVGAPASDLKPLPDQAVRQTQTASTLERIVAAYRERPRRSEGPRAAEMWFDEQAAPILRRAEGSASRYAVQGLRPQFLAAAARMAQDQPDQAKKALQGKAVEAVVPAGKREFKTVLDVPADETLPEAPLETKGASAQEIILRFLPEIVTLVLVVAVPSLGLLWGLKLIMVRAMNLAAFLIHGSGHWAAERLFELDPAKRVVRIREGVSWTGLLTSLLPLAPLPQTLAKPIQLDPASGPQTIRRIASGGILANTAAVVIPTATVLVLMAFGTGGWLLPVLGVWAGFSLITAASAPDLQTMFGLGFKIACGPFFVIRIRGKGEKALVTPRMKRLMGITSRYAASRGGQSAGFSIEAEKRKTPKQSRKNSMPVILFDKLVKGKRQRIVEEISKSVDRFARRMERRGFKPRPEYEAFLAHLRYATGGATNWNNAQPHWHEDPVWVDRFEVEVTDAGASAVHRRQALAGNMVEVHRGPVLAANMIGHNGDKDAAKIRLNFGGKMEERVLSQGQLRLFFKAAMPLSSSEGDSDSKTIAEWIDYHLTQGILSKSLRAGWFSSVADAEAILEGRFKGPSPDQWEDWSQEITGKLQDLLAQPGALEPGEASLSAATPKTREAFRQMLKQNFATRVPAGSMKEFTELTERAFFDQDLKWCMSRAASTFFGTFALMVYTTLEARIGVFALTQQFSIGANLTRGELVGSAEPMGVVAAMADSPEDKALQVMLKHGQFATVEMNLAKQPSIQEAVRIYDAHTAYDPGPWKKETLASNPWFPVTGNPKIDLPSPPSTDSDFDELGDNLQDIPAILQAVTESVKMGNRNYAPMMYLRSLIREKSKNWLSHANGMKQSGKIDIIIHGVDYNEQLAKEFEDQLYEVAPYLRVRAMNSGKAIKLLMRAKERKDLGLDPKLIDNETIFIGLSNSAQTQSAAVVTRLAREFQGMEKATPENPGRGFVISQQLFNSMSAALGQGYQLEDPTLPVTFQNLSHLTREGKFRTRWNEAATVEPVAMQAILTEIFIGIVQDLVEFAETTSSDPFGLQEEIDVDDIWAFREFQKVSYSREMPERIGMVQPYAKQRPGHEQALENEARYRADNVTEWLDAYVAFVGYVLASSIYGKLGLFAWSAAFIGGMASGFLGGMAALFFVWLTIVGVRIYRDRPRWDRIGTRNEVFIDKGWVAHSLDRYTKTLFSLAPGFMAVNTWAADNVSDALHRYGMVAHRGTVTIHRLTDDRIGEEAAQDALDANKVRKQIEGIFFNKGQPQAHVKVREGAGLSGVKLLGAKAPPLVVMTDHMGELRERYDGTMSRFALAWVNNRLLELSDGLVAELWIGYRQSVLVSSWAERKLVQLLGRRIGTWTAKILRVHRIFQPGETANEAKVQSTEHPVGEQPSNLPTMKYRQTRRGQAPPVAEEASPPTRSAVNYRITVMLDRRIKLSEDIEGGQEIILTPSKGKYRGESSEGAKWVGEWRDAEKTQFILTEDGVEVPLPQMTPKLRDRIVDALRSGARMARPTAPSQLMAGVKRLFAISASLGMALSLAAAFGAFKNYETLLSFAGEFDPAVRAMLQQVMGTDHPSPAAFAMQVGFAAGVGVFLGAMAIGTILGSLKAAAAAIQKIIKSLKSPAPDPYPKFKPRYLIQSDTSKKQGGSGARLADEQPGKIGVLLKDAASRAVWLEQWSRWTGRPADASAFIFVIASEADRASDIDRLRQNGAWWVVDAVDEPEQIPDWLAELEQVRSGERALLRSVIEKMSSAPSADLWKQEDWARLLEISERSLPQAAPVRLVAEGRTLMPTAAGNMVQADPSELQALLNDLDRRLADALMEPSRLRNRDAVLSLAAGWAKLAKNISDTGSGAAALLGSLRTPFAAFDPSYHAAASIPDRALVVTDLDVFTKDGELPYRMRVERMERLSKGRIASALLVSDPAIRTLSQLHREHPEAVIFGDRVIFADVDDAAGSIAAAAESWGLASTPTVRITARVAPEASELSEIEYLTVALDSEATTTIGVLEIAAQLLLDPTAAIPGLKKVSDRSYAYHWPKAIPVDYRRLIEALRSVRTSA